MLSYFEPRHTFSDRMGPGQCLRPLEPQGASPCHFRRSCSRRRRVGDNSRAPHPKVRPPARLVLSLSPSTAQPCLRAARSRRLILLREEQMADSFSRSPEFPSASARRPFGQPRPGRLPMAHSISLAILPRCPTHLERPMGPECLAKLSDYLLSSGDYVLSGLVQRALPHRNGFRTRRRRFRGRAKAEVPPVAAIETLLAAPHLASLPCCA